NPYILSGQPFLANGQHSGFYPFSLIFYIIPLAKAYGWFTVSQLWLAGLFMYGFVRVLRGNRFGALIAGITYSLSTFFIVSVVFTMIIASAIWLPLVLAMIELIIRKQEEKGLVSYSPIPYIVIGAFALGIQALAGHPEITYYTLLVSGFYTLCRLFILWRQQNSLQFAIRLAIWLLLMVILGVSLGAVQLGPMLEVVTQNFRDNSVTLSQVQGWALPYRRVITFLIPDFFGSPAHHGYFDFTSWQWQPLSLNAYGTINPLCPNCTSWDTKTAVEAGAYVGILSLILAVLAIGQNIANIWSQQNSKERFSGAGPISIFTALTLLSLLFAFGTPLYALLFYGLPGWNQLHSPFRWIYPFTLSIAVLAGLGATWLTQWVTDQQVSSTSSNLFLKNNMLATGLRYLKWALLIGGIAGLIVMILALMVPAPFIQIATFVFDRSGLAQNAFANGHQFFNYQWPNFFKFFLMITASGLVLYLSLIAKAWWKPVAIIVIALDLLIAGWGFNPAVNPDLLDFRPEVVSWLEAQQEKDPYYRLTSFDTPDGRGNKVFLANVGMYNNLFDVRGYDSVILGQYAQFMHLIQENGDLLFNRIGPLYYDGYNALDSALLDLLGVRYVLTTVDINNPNYTLVYDNEIRVYENNDALPRAFMVHEIFDLAPFKESCETGECVNLGLALRNLNPRQNIILDGETNGLGRDLLSGESQTILTNSEPGVTITEYTPNQVMIEASVTEAGWLVLADTYFKGWRAYATPLTNGTLADDEIEVTLHRANGNFRAVQLPPGAWQVRFRYSPRSFQLGLYGSFLAFVALIFTAGYWSWGKLYREHEDDSPIKRVAKNSIVPMVMALSNRLIDFAFALLMLRILEPEGAGRYAFAVAFIGLTEILTRYGLGTLVTRDVAADRTESNRYLSNVSVLRLYLWVAAIPLMALVLAFYIFYGDTTSDVIITITIFAIGTLFSNFSDGLTAIFYAHEKAEYPAAIASITTLTRVTIGALVLILGWGIIGLAGASLIANLVTFLLLSYLLITKIFRPQFNSDRPLQKEMMAESFPLMVNHLLSTIFFRIDVFILKPTWGDESVGLYNAAYKYIDGINVIPQYFTLAIFPLMSRFAADSRDSLIRAYILSLRLLLLLAIPLAIGTPFIARELILFLAGEKFLPGSMIVLQLLIWFLPFSFINQVTQYVLIAINQQRFLTRAFIIGVLFNTITNLIFIPLYGFQAAAVTTIFSEWALLIPFYLLIKKNLCTVPWFDVIWRPTVAAAVMGGIMWFMGDANFFVTVFVGTVSYFTILILVGGLNQEDMGVVWRAIPIGRLRSKFTEP
ncbi:MAG: oligosaccharide flippase family protein, partial [Chloroflexota bacterium]